MQGPMHRLPDQADAIAALQSFSPVDYEKWVDVIPGVRARYWNAGHLLGSASIELEFAGAGGARPHFETHPPRMGRLDLLKLP